jgi:multidrug resistance efflux pump
MSNFRTAYTPIKTPLGRRLDFFRLRILPVIVFLLVGVVVFFLWTDRVQSPTFIGKAEGLVAPVTAPETGLIRRLLVEPFDAVRAGDPLFTIEITDSLLATTRTAVLRAQIDLLQKGLDPIANWQRNRINYASLRTEQMEEQIAISALGLRELQQERTLSRLQSLVETGGAMLQDAEDARLELDLIREERSLRQEHAGRVALLLEQIDRTDERFSTDGDDPIQSAVRVLELEIEALQRELMPVTIVAPIDGIVSVIHFSENSYLPRGEIIMHINDSRVRYLTGYIRQPFSVRPMMGDEVHVRLRTRDKSMIIAEIDRVGGRVELIDPSLQRPGLTNESGLPVRIRLPLDYDWPLYPGEIVDVGLY